MMRLTVLLLFLSFGAFAQTRNVVDVNGLKQGVHDGRSGSLLFERTYRNDMLNGFFRKYVQDGTTLETGYYKNGLKDSTWTEYAPDGTVRSQYTWVNGQRPGAPIIRAVFNHETRFVPQREVKSDTSVINETSLRVYKLYDSRDSGYPRHRPEYLHSIRVCNNGGIRIHAGIMLFDITPGGVVVQQHPDTICGGRMNVHSCTTNRIVKENKDGEIEISYLLRKNKFPAQAGTVEIEQKQMRCDDTGYNPVKITRDGKSIYFKDAGNVILFEYDVDGNGTKEIYLINYFSCMGWLQIYKITE